MRATQTSVFLLAFLFRLRKLDINVGLSLVEEVGYLWRSKSDRFETSDFLLLVFDIFEHVKCEEFRDATDFDRELVFRVSVIFFVVCHGHLSPSSPVEQAL